MEDDIEVDEVEIGKCLFGSSLEGRVEIRRHFLLVSHGSSYRNELAVRRSIKTSMSRSERHKRRCRKKSGKVGSGDGGLDGGKKEEKDPHPYQ